MRWYLNDASLQGQFENLSKFESIIRALIELRFRNPEVRRNFRLTRAFLQATVAHETDVRYVIGRLSDRDLRSVTLSWFDRTGPFVDDEQLEEEDNYFEFDGLDVTLSGLGEAARRVKVGTAATTFSFSGGARDFTGSPLLVDHGLVEARLGCFQVQNICTVQAFEEQALSLEPLPQSWPTLFEAARRRFPNLEIGPIERNPMLAREPFEASIRDRTLELLTILNDYVGARSDDGSEGADARSIIDNHFTGDGAAFSGESATNRSTFEREMTFSRTADGKSLLAHWHGKIRHRFFRMHFEWPLEGGRKKLEVFYLGPKLTKG